MTLTEQRELESLRARVQELEATHDFHKALEAAEKVNAIPTMEDVYQTIHPDWVVGATGIAFKPGYQNGNRGFIPSENHALQLAAIATVMVVAEYVNKGWVPDWKTSTDLVRLRTYLYDGVFKVISSNAEIESGIYFQSVAAAQRAIDILNADNPLILKHYFGIFE